MTETPDLLASSGPGHASVTVNFDCADMDEAKTVISGWVLSPGCSVNVSYQQMLSPGETDDSGSVVPIPPVVPPEPEPEPPVMDNTLPGDLPPE